MIESFINSVDEWLSGFWIIQQVEQLFFTDPLLYLLIVIGIPIGISILLSIIYLVMKYVIHLICSIKGGC